MAASITLSAEEERWLTERGQAGDTSAIDRLVRAYQGFVISIAKKYGRYGVPMNDLVQEGTIGLLQAIKRFDPNAGVRLSTYARSWIMAAIQDCVVRSWSLVRGGTSSAQKALFFHVRRLATDLKDGADSITEDILRPLAQRLGVPIKDALSLAGRAAGFDRSLDRTLRPDVGTTWADTLADDAPTPEEEVAAANDAGVVRTAIARALDRLPYREKLIISARYLSDLKSTRAAIGHELGLSKERVRQLEIKALDRLRRMLSPLRQDR